MREIVYFIQCERNGPIKIGHCEGSVLDVADGKLKRLSSRLDALQTGCPYQLFIRGVIDGGMETETDIHRTFKRIRIRGEWFKPHKELLKFIKNTSKASKYLEKRNIQIEYDDRPLYLSDDHWTLGQLSSYLSMSPNYIIKLCQKGDLPFVNIERKFFFEPLKINNWIQDHTQYKTSEKYLQKC